MAGNGPPPKPWEQSRSTSGPVPFKPSSPGSTSEVVEASGTAKPGEIVSRTDKSATSNINSLGRPVPPRPWQQNYGSYTNYGGYTPTTNYNIGYGTGVYGRGMYGNRMYTQGYGGPYGGSPGMCNGGMYNSGMGGPMAGYGMGTGGPYGGQDPNGAPPSPPGFWISLLRVMHGVVNFFGGFAILIDQNTQALHLFLNSLLQLFDRSGLLYAELARFVLRILGLRTKPKMGPSQGPNGHPGPSSAPRNHDYVEEPKAAPGGSWEKVWGHDMSK